MAAVNRSFVVTAAGAVAGVLIAIIGMAMSAGLVIDGAAGFTLVDGTAGTGRGTLTAGTDVFYLYVLLIGLLGGGAIAYLSAALARAWNPDEPRFSPMPVSLIGAVTGAVTAYVVMRSGIGLGGSIVDEVVTVSAFRAVVIFMTAGAVAGGTVALTAEWLSRPATVGLAGDAWPADRAAFTRENVPAMLIPLIAIILVAGVVIFLGQSLVAIAESLHDAGTAGVVIVASLVSIIVLGGAAFLVYRRGPASD